MNNDKTAATAPKTEQQDFVKTIGKTAYLVKVHFSKTSKETMTDKVLHLLKNEASQSLKM